VNGDAAQPQPLNGTKVCWHIDTKE
jgi:hypothetical protein